MENESNNREFLQRLYADVGGVADIAEHLCVRLPTSKTDEGLAKALAQIGLPAITPILPHLLMWLQDGNWSINRPIARFLMTVDEPLLEPIRVVLQSRNDAWKYGVLESLVKDSELLRCGLRRELHRIVTSPSPGERAEGVDELAKRIVGKGPWRR